ncbi:Type 4 prepilin-like proteins leader peptide-processing enzyme [Stieleria magnilauensis]|uniref:Type 4 prepilin-like proteins leader peptide-processing enzyme n=1 Tax=Stieleria magnilauensis TaxID=2527963 RepID=A0ABX5XLL2_9BACT|nr:Type 4 prepilin-like proteins leader peptide-processing enzyme [Planctomycetes bacterium TBK1r]
MPRIYGPPDETDSLIAFWITLPIELRLVLLALLGLAIGVLANWAIYRLAWDARLIGPWVPADETAPPRKMSDRIPILGWLGLRREASIHGSGFWIRPMLIELAMAIGIPLYYWFVTQTGLLLPPADRVPVVIAGVQPWMTIVFVSHLIMISLMVAATFIDFDEQTIPDEITIPGTLIALVVACVTMTDSFLPALDLNGVLVPIAFYLPAPAEAPKWTGPTGWWTGVGIWTMWCFALSNRRLILRRGPLKAFEYFFASLVRNKPYNPWKALLAMWLIGAVGVRIVFGIGGDAWIGLLTALIGLGVGGGVVWAIRIVGSLAMRREAMGFGDVTLMAMIGAFIGWQGAVMSFFLAPIAAIAIVLVYFIITRNSEIPFGPYLCAGTLLSIFGWDRLVNGWFLGNLAILGPFMLWLFVALTGIMGVMLYFWRVLKETMFGE